MPGRFRRENGLNWLRKFILLLSVVAVLVLEIGCGEQYRPVANPIIGQGGQPQTTHFAFVVNKNPTNNNSSTMKIDVSGDTNLETQTVGAGAISESFLAGNTGALFTANSLADSVSEFTTITTNQQVLNINLPLGSRPISVTTQRAGFMYALNSGNNVNCPNSGSVTIVDTTSLVATSTICVGPSPTSIAQLPDGTYIYVTNGDNTVSVIDPALGAVIATVTQALGLGQNPVFAVPAPNSSYMFIINKGDGSSPGTLSLIASSNNQVAATVPLGVGPTFGYVDTHLNRLYVTNTGGNSVSVFDISNIQPGNSQAIPTLGTVNVGSGPVGVTALPNGTKFYVANSRSNDVSVVSATSFGVLKTIPVGQNPVWVASEPTSTKVYTANFNSGTITILQTVNDSIVSTMNAPAQDPNCSSNCALQQPSMILTY